MFLLYRVSKMRMNLLNKNTYDKKYCTCKAFPNHMWLWTGIHTGNSKCDCANHKGKTLWNFTVYLLGKEILFLYKYKDENIRIGKCLKGGTW